MNDRTPRQWAAVDVVVRPSAVEAVEHAFNLLRSLGTEIDDFRKDKTGDLCVVGYFEALPDNAALETALKEALKAYDVSRDLILSTAVRTVEDTDWLAEWKQYWKPTSVGKFIIAPPWSDVPKSDKLVIRIEPNMAFGTGTHETTQLCLGAISEYLCDGMAFLDVGTGTGILAIAAAKLSPISRITACDLDADSIKIARANAVANGVGDRIKFFEGSITGEVPTHAFTGANLTLDVITRLLPRLIANTSEILLLSGILAEQEEAIRDEISKFEISDLKFTHAGEWLSVLIYK